MKEPSKEVQQLRAFILKGGYQPGNRLPPERNLAQSFGISRVALRHALAQLETEELIWRHVGKGTFVGARPADPKIEAIFGDGLKSAEALVEMREIVEPATARLAAERAGQTDIKRMRRFLSASRETKDALVFNRCCEELHKAIAQATQNPLLIKLYEILNPVQALANAVGDRPTLSETEHDFFFAQHRDIVEAIADRAPDRAEKLMRSHIHSIGDDASQHSAQRSLPGALRIGPADASTAAIFITALQSLSERFGETAFLSRLTDRGVELIEAILPSGGAGRTVVHPGAGLRPTVCATAKVLYGFSESPEVGVISKAEARTIRKAGHAVSDEEIDNGVYCIAVPVRFGNGTPRHAIGLIGMKSRMRKRQESDYLRALDWAVCAVAAELAATLGIDVPNTLPGQRSMSRTLEI